MVPVHTNKKGFLIIDFVHLILIYVCTYVCSESFICELRTRFTIKIYLARIRYVFYLCTYVRMVPIFFVDLRTHFVCDWYLK